MASEALEYLLPRSLSFEDAARLEREALRGGTGRPKGSRSGGVSPREKGS